MASQISHVIYSEKYFSAIETGKLSSVPDARYPAGKINKEEFILGSVFPDIRRIDSAIKRKDTHLCFDSIDLNFSNLSSFEAGWKFHLYCDMRREEILTEYNFYSLPHTDDFDGLSAKLLEDKLLYAEYANWEKLVYFFQNPPYFSNDAKVGEDSFFLWYAILAQYVKKRPSNNAIHTYLSKQPHNAPRADDIVKSLEELEGNKKVIEILFQIKEEII